MEQNELTVIIYYKKTLNSCYVDFTENEYIINALKVLDGFKKQGIGTYLIKSAEDIIKKLGGDCAYLFVLGKNEWVHNWYKRLGCTDTDVECEDGYLKMRKELNILRNVFLTTIKQSIYWEQYMMLPKNIKYGNYERENKQIYLQCYSLR